MKFAKPLDQPAAYSISHLVEISGEEMIPGNENETSSCRSIARKASGETFNVSPRRVLVILTLEQKLGFLASTQIFEG